MSETLTARIASILQKIEAIEYISQNIGSITQALDEEKMARPAILMHLIAISEQLDKISKSDESIFAPKDIKGAYSVRNFIAHDYDGINLAIVEKVIREHLPKIKHICKEFLNK